jgi:hypothetical protein
MLELVRAHCGRVSTSVLAGVFNGAEPLANSVGEIIWRRQVQSRCTDPNLA